MPAFILPYLDLIFILGGFFGLYVGAQALVRGAVALSEKLRIPRLIIGVVIVGLATSLPELMVSLTAARNATPDIAIGAIIGSNIANIGLILGLAALIAPMAASLAGVRRDVLAMLAATTLMAVIFSSGGISARTGWGLICTLAVFVAAVLLFQKGPASPEKTTASLSWPVALIFVLGGAVLLTCAAELAVNGATNTARAMGVSDAVVGLTLVALGTALPELTVAIISAFRREADLTLGNVIGSNLFNILGILGLTAVLYPLNVSPAFLRHDVPVLTGFALLLAVLIFLHGRLGRLSGALLLMLYATYIGWLLVGFEGLMASWQYLLNSPH